MKIFKKIVFIAIAVFLTAIALFEFSKLIPTLPKSSFYRELAIAFGQMVFQSLFLLKKQKSQILNYLKNLMTVSLIGSLLLIPNLVLNHFLELNFIFNLVWFFAVVLVMFLDHIRRVKNLKFPKFLTATWVLYRVLVLIIINL